MIKSLSTHAMAVLALGGAGATATQAPARADTFAAAYTCTVPVLGSRPVVIRGTLTALPDRAVAGQTVRFQLHIAGLSLQTPLAIESWTAVAGIEVTGAQNTAFRMAGSGGLVSPRRPITGDLFGAWTPRVRGVDRLRGGTVAITARIARVGVLTSTCLPNDPRPVLETIGVVGYHRFARADTDV
ncbi:hypothetical protein [Actinomadura sp. DC4]|uniref:hypothetical protein n=1 Tax=Actinomadura sp. DC4 TaxID=3055069 RepID=UPI0025AF069C|nr:hypothetical protein [Actinomadura sp. DC4]MDN3358213.1 hypothetical protein [Actinomadura sp. DC4]